MIVLRTVCLALAVLAAGAEAADTYPSKPIRFVVAFPPGGGTDLVARTIAPRLAERLAQQVVVDNRPGAGGNLGTEIVAKSAPDGYTMLMGSVGPLAINASLFARMPFDPLKDLAPVTLAASTPNILVVHPSLPVTNVQELIALAKARPGAINFASSGGNTDAARRGAVQFDGRGEDGPRALQGCGSAGRSARRRVQVVLYHAARAAAAAGRLRALAVASRGACRPRPSCRPSTAQHCRGSSSDRHGVMVPAGTPDAVVAKLNHDIVAVLRMPEVAERLSSQGAEAIGSTPQEFAAYIKAETAKWAKVVRESGAKAE